MPRIPPPLLESIKRDVSCVGVLEATGAVFEKHGPDVVCRCPFHDDHTPSLVVSVGKNLWKCHGACGIGGDVIALTQKLKGVSFRHAVELLAEGLPASARAEAVSVFAATSAGTGAAQRCALVRRSTLAALPCPLDAGVDDARLLQQVVDYYHQRLQQPGSAGRAYLAKRGLDHPELIRRFSLGFADRSLGLRLPNKQRKEGADLRQRLEGLGIFRSSSGHEHFAGSVVVPVFDAHGAVGEIYGRKVTDNLRTGTIKHTYLPGQHRGVWNSGPGLVDGDGAVVLCEALIDAMTWWVQGVTNVTASYGVNGFTDDHWQAFAQARVRSVLLSYDADAAGEQASATLAEQCIARGLTVYRLGLPPGEDVNSVAVSAKDAAGAELRRILDEAQWLGGAPRVIVPDGVPVVTAIVPTPAAAAADSLSPLIVAASASAPHAAPAATSLHLPGLGLPDGVRLREDGPDVHLLIGTRAYRVRGLERTQGVDVLKINLRCSALCADGNPHPERFHVDTFDLYQTRLRQHFITQAAHEVALHADVVKADLGKVLLSLEALQAERARTAASSAAHTTTSHSNAATADPAASMTAPERDAALTLLRSPDLLNHIAADLGRCGLIGEEANKRAAILACVSRLTDSPLALLVQSSSAAGKTTLMDGVLRFMPSEAQHRYSAMSGRSLFYLGTSNLRHRILAIAEEEGAQRASYALKLLQSDGFLSMAATGKDPESGRLVTHDYRVEGPIMLFLTTTAIDLDPELVNRCLVLAVDEGAEQTAAIHAAQRRARTLAGFAAKAERAAAERLHQHAQRLLRPFPVVIPEAERLRFAAHTSRLRRDHAKYLTLISAVTLLYQHQRETRTHRLPDGSQIEYLEATADDIAQAGDLAAALLGRTLDDLPPQTRRLWDALRAHVATHAATNGIPLARVVFTRRDAQQAVAWSYKQIRTHLDRLCAQEYVVMTVKPGAVAQYAIVDGIGDDRPAAPTCVDAPAEAHAEAHAATGVSEDPSTTPTLPGSARGCPGSAHAGWARFDDGKISSSRVDGGGLPTISDITDTPTASLAVAS